MKEFPPFRLDVADQSLWRGERRIHLTPKAFAILSYLLERAGRLVTQAELLEAHWPDTFVQPEVLKSQILDIRTALGDSARDSRFIETVPRRGCRFIAAVRDGAQTEAVVEGSSAEGLVGRDLPLQQLRDSLQKASVGERQIVFVTGEQGIGKTTLVDTFVREITGNRVQIARGQCLEGFGVVKEPYYPVLEAMGQLARSGSRELLAEVLESHAPTWLVQLPALVKRDHRESLQRELVGATRERMIREICEGLEILTEQSTLVLLLEDLHWTDHATVDLIASLAHRRTPAKFMLIGTFRPVDLVLTNHPLKQVSHALKGRRLTREISLTPLSESEVAEYLSGRSGRRHKADAPQTPHELARWLQRQTEGNPLFLVTILEHLAQLGHIVRSDSAWTIVTPLQQVESAVPDTLRQMIDVEIERLSAREQLMLEAASVHGNVFSSGVTASVLEFSSENVEDVCERLARQNHMVRRAPAERLANGQPSQRYEFVHAAFRSVFYHRLAPARRAKLHRRFGEAIEELYAEDRARASGELAGHFEQCADWPKAVAYLRLAARIAWQRFDYREAVKILEHALEVADNLERAGRTPVELSILDSLAMLQHALHDTARVIPALERLATKAVEAGVVQAEVRAVVALAVMRANQDSRACQPLLERLERLFGAPQDPRSQAETRALWASLRVSLLGWDAQIATQHATDVATVRAGGDRLATASLLMDHSYLQWASSDYAGSCRNAEESLPILLEAGRVVRYLHGRDLIATNLVFLGQWGRALDTLDEGIEDARKNEAPLRLLMPLVFKAWVHLLATDYVGVAELCAEALPALSQPFLHGRWWIAAMVAAAAERGLGRAQAAMTRLVDLRDAADQRPFMLSWYWTMPLQLEIVDACLALDDLDRARVEAGRALDLTLGTAERTWQALAWEASARIAILQGDAARARKHIENGLDTIRGLDAPLAAWRVHATAARVSRMHADADAERRHSSIGRSIVTGLIDSLATRPALQQAFRASPLVAALLGGDLRIHAASGKAGA